MQETLNFLQKYKEALYKDEYHNMKTQGGQHKAYIFNLV